MHRQSRHRLTLLHALFIASGAPLSVVRAAPPSESHDLELAVGQNHTFSASDVKSYSEGAAGIVEVKLTPTGSQFVVVGLNPGSTTLLLLKRDGSEETWNIRVFARPAASVAGELEQLIGDQTGIRVKRIGARFFIEGGVSTEADLHRIEHIAKLYGGQVESLVVLGGVAADRKINIRIDFFFVQYDKTKSFSYGIDWPGRYGAGASTFTFDFLQRALTSATAVVAQPLPALDLAASDGWAKLLKHATVITANGAQASFSSGGVQNFAVVGGLSNTIEAIRFGTEVRVLPRFDPSSRELAIAIDADVADLTEPVGATDLPGQNLSKLATNVALKLGQSVVLSGIRTSSEFQSTSGIPGLSEIPILGLLFGSEVSRRQDVEGALFVVPSVLDTTGTRASELIDQALKSYERYDGDLAAPRNPFRVRSESGPPPSLR